MKLVYFDETYGRNFGDLLNKPIFEHYLPEYFDNSDGPDFLGIGSILGLPFAKSSKKKIVFGSGYAYGTVPQVDDSYDFFCVRGPLTAKTLGIPQELAVADGAYLLRGMRKHVNECPKYSCSIMLHHDSLKKFDWARVCESVGINFIDPTGDPIQILEAIARSGLVLAEAMHAAIAADALRVAWLPIACYSGVNTFKWLDFTSAVGLSYRPHRLPSLYVGNEYVASIVKTRSKNLLDIKQGLSRHMFSLYQTVQQPRNIRKVEDQLHNLRQSGGILTDERKCDHVYERLLEKLEQFRKRYPL